MAERDGAFGTNSKEKNHLQGNLREMDHLEHLGLNWSVILKWILKKKGGKAWPEFIVQDM